MSFDETNRGALFKNEDKKGDKFPDYKGQLNVNGQDFWISAWLKTSKQGTKFMSLSVQSKDRQSSEPTRRGQPSRDDDSDSIPF